MSVAARTKEDQRAAASEPGRVLRPCIIDRLLSTVGSDHPGFVAMRTRVVDMLSGEQLPRIC